MDEQIPELRWMAWEITARCNLACIHCRSAASYECQPDEFSAQEGLDFLDHVASFASPVVVLTGGEPLLRPDCFDLARHGTDLGLRMCLATNGTLVKDETCVQMKEAGIRMVSLSLDGATAERHDAFRQQAGAFEATLSAARLLREAEIPFLINSSFTRANRDEIPAVKALAKELGAKAWYLFMIVPTGRAEGLGEELIPAEDYNDILAWHLEEEAEEDELLMRPTCAPFYYRMLHQAAGEDGKAVRRRNLSFATGKSKGCLAGQWIAFVDHRGDLHPCSYFARSVGNVRETPFEGLWAEAPLLKALRDPAAYGGKCGACEFLRVCGGCRARADALYGDPFGSEPFCTYHPPNWDGTNTTKGKS